MDATGYARARRYEPGWVLAGLGWGVLLGLATTAAPVIFLLMTSGEAYSSDDLIVPLMWVFVLGIHSAGYGGVAGMLVGLVVMLAVGRDPEARAARRVPGTVALLGIPLVLLVLLW